MDIMNILLCVGGSKVYGFWFIFWSHAVSCGL